ncbi:MAG: hypothetical protein JO129_03035 [Candidatus Dependentiae bacterium]|nr:hypothetical protein [Candidatus Dependentiae bacterium]
MKKLVLAGVLFSAMQVFAMEERISSGMSDCELQALQKVTCCVINTTNHINSNLFVYAAIGCCVTNRPVGTAACLITGCLFDYARSHQFHDTQPGDNYTNLHRVNSLCIINLDSNNED